MLSGRLGLERARIPHADRQGLVRRRAALLFRQREVISGMIDRIKTLLMPGDGTAAGAPPAPR